MVCCNYWNSFSHLNHLHAPVLSKWPAVIISRTCGARKKSDETAMTENPEGWFGIGEKSGPLKITQLLQFFVTAPQEKWILGENLGGNIQPLDAQRRIENKK